MTRVNAIPKEIPEDFEEAYGGLVELVESISREEASEELLHEKADEYRHAHCRGSAVLAGAALRALRYEIARRDLQAGADSHSEELCSLARVEAALEGSPSTRSSADGESSEIVEVALPEQVREAMPNGRGFVMGELQILFEPSQSRPYGHMSVSHPNRYPTYEEMSKAARAPSGLAPNLWAWLPKPEEARGLQPNTVHLYVMPPEELLG